jgi:hypothetical protein
MIQYNGKEYPTTTVNMNPGWSETDPDEPYHVEIATTDLEDVLFPNKHEDNWTPADRTAEAIDDDIFYYIEPDWITLPEEQLVKLIKENI